MWTLDILMPTLSSELDSNDSDDSELWKKRNYAFDEITAAFYEMEIILIKFKYKPSLKKEP